MNEQTVIDASRNIMDADPVLGSMIVILMAVIAGLVFWIKAILKDKDTRVDLHLDDVRKYAAESEQTRQVIAANTAQITTNTETVKVMAAILQERRHG